MDGVDTTGSPAKAGADALRARLRLEISRSLAAQRSADRLHGPLRTALVPLSPHPHDPTVTRWQVCRRVLRTAFPFSITAKRHVPAAHTGTPLRELVWSPTNPVEPSAEIAIGPIRMRSVRSAEVALVRSASTGRPAGWV